MYKRILCTLKTMHFHLMEIVHILMLFLELVLPQIHFSPINLLTDKLLAMNPFFDSVILSGI